MNKKIVIGALVVAVALGAGISVYLSRTNAGGGTVVGAGMDNPAQVTMPQKDTLGGAVNTQAQTFPNWSCVGDRCAANITFSINGGEYFKLLTNTAGSPLSFQGKPVYIDGIEVETPARASTTARIVMGTTTFPTLYSYVNPGTTGATTTFGSFILATGTPAGLYTYPAGTTTPATQSGVAMHATKINAGVSVLIGYLAGAVGIPSYDCGQACSATSSWRFSGSDQALKVRVSAHAYLRQN